ncbi:hypothetical protein Leryth_015780 [Lithospermum erythrorhizon]|nr:hypothetical protein Leryth_015780 [Lithospermum erythrorhizon]
MDLTTTPTKSVDSENDTPPHVQPITSLSFTNGAIKKHHPHPLYNHRLPLQVYRWTCPRWLWREFMPVLLLAPQPPYGPHILHALPPVACHRNFHRREQDDCNFSPTPISTLPHIS